MVIFVTMPSLRAIIFARSTFAPPTSMPCSPRWCSASSYFSLEASSAFDGMQPTFRQVPPSAGSPFGVVHFSAQATFSPSCAARIAAM